MITVNGANYSLRRIIATPGRFLHLIVEMNLDLRSADMIVFDEADRYVKNGMRSREHG